MERRRAAVGRRSRCSASPPTPHALAIAGRWTPSRPHAPLGAPQDDAAAPEPVAARLENASDVRAASPARGAQGAGLVPSAPAGRTTAGVTATTRAVWARGSTVRRAAATTPATSCPAGRAGAVGADAAVTARGVGVDVGATPPAASAPSALSGPALLAPRARRGRSGRAHAREPTGSTRGSCRGSQPSE
jgi:hypothetical protein